MLHGLLEIKMNDEKLIQVSNDIDNALLDIAEKYDMDFIIFASLVFARITRLGVDLDQKDILLKLMNKTADLIENTSKAEKPNIH